MKYYKIINSTSKKEIGKYPQSINSIWKKNKFSDNSIYNINKKTFNRKKIIVPNLIFNTKYIATDLISSTSLSLFEFLIISYRFLVFINNTIKKKSKYWQIKVYNDEIKFNYRSMKYEVKDKEKLRVYDYFIFHISYPKKDFINYTKSKFYSYSETENLIEYDKVDFLTQAQIKFYNKMYKKDKIKPKVNERKIIEDNLKFNNYKEFVEYRKNLKQKSKIYKITPLKLVFNTSNCTEDFFRITDNYNNTMGYYASERLKNEIEEKGFTGIEFLPLDKLSTAYNIEMI